MPERPIHINVAEEIVQLVIEPIIDHYCERKGVTSELPKYIENAISVAKAESFRGMSFTPEKSFYLIKQYGSFHIQTEAFEGSIVELLETAAKHFLHEAVKKRLDEAKARWINRDYPDDPSYWEQAKIENGYRARLRTDLLEDVIKTIA